MKKELLVTLEEFEESEKYWLSKLAGVTGEVRVNSDFPHTAGHAKSSITLEFENAVRERLLQVSKNNDLSLYIILLTAFKILLYKYTWNSDIIVASPIYSAENREYNKFVAMRDTIEPSMTFKELLMKIRQTVLESYKNEHYPLENLVELLGINDQAQLFRNVLLLENIHNRDFFLDIVNDPGSDIAFCARKSDGKLETEIIYNSKMLEKESVQQLFTAYSCVLKNTLEKTDISITDVELITEEEKNRVLASFNETGKDYPLTQPIQRLFEQQVEKTPQNIAVRSIIDENVIFGGWSGPDITREQWNKLVNCCFDKNPYIFFSSLEPGGKKNGCHILKTHRHNSVVVNGNLLTLLDCFNGNKSTGAIFKELEEKRVEFIIHTVEPDDILEIVIRSSRKDEIVLDGQFTTFARLVRLLYDNHLIRLKGVRFDLDRSSDLVVSGATSAAVFDETAGAGTEEIDLDTLLELDRAPSPAHVLLLGDTPGMPSCGLLYMASYLKRNSISAYCRFNDINLDYASLKKSTENLLQAIRPGVVTVSMKWFLYIARVFEICKIVKEFAAAELDHDITVVVGGNTASYYHEEVVGNDYVDYVIRGDGELPLLKICRGEDPADIPNCVYKIDGRVVANPIDYVQYKENSDDIYLSHLDEILLSRCAPVFGSFFVYTHKGCGMNCIYCGGCKEAQGKIFNRTKVTGRPVEAVRKDIIEAKNYTSTYLFDFDAPNKNLTGYCRKIWEGIDLSSHFCIFVNLIPPDRELVELVNSTFKYVYYEFDFASLSERHRKELVSRHLIKPQPKDEQIFNFLDICEMYDNNEVRINLINGLPYYTVEDIRESERVLELILRSYSCFSNLHWARLHAQPGAPVAENAGEYGMHSLASGYEEFLKSSETAFGKNSEFSNMEYPYIYYNDEELNSQISKHYMEVNLRLAQHTDSKRNLRVTRQLTFLQLNETSNRLARELTGKGVGPGCIAGLIIEDSLEIAIGIIAVLKAGGAYMPIDPQSQGDRKKYMITNSNPAVLVIQQHLMEQHRDIRDYFPPECIVIVDDDASYSAEPSNLEGSQRPDDPAYVIYTSGTTGMPKGTLILHTGLVNYTLWRIDSYGYREQDVALQLLSYCFDGFGSNFYTSLLAGGALVMVPDEQRLNLEYIKESVRTNKVTNTSFVPGMYRVLLDGLDREDLESFRFVVLAGEACDAGLIRTSEEKAPHIKLIDEYGPTEATVTAAGHSHLDVSNTAVIGKPIANTCIYILDNTLKPVPVNVPGELCIAGPGVARGYLNNPELTAEKFFDTPYARIYRTGDIARWLPDGSIRFLGRRDDQVKIRGHRIELADVEVQLLKHPDIKEAVVLVTDVQGGDSAGQDSEHALCAYFVPVKDISEKELEEYLFFRLPDYMVPSFFVQLEKIPLTSNGKIDRKVLPAPGADQNKSSFKAPGTPLEKELVVIWADVLSIEADTISVDGNFFKLGGHSLKATLLLSKIHKEMNVKLHLEDIFRMPTVSDLARHISGLEESKYMSIVPAASKPYYALSSAQKRLFVLNQKESDKLNHNIPTILWLEGHLDRKKLEDTFNSLIQRHESLRTSFKVEAGDIVQQVHAEIEFKIEYSEVKDNVDPDAIINSFIIPFDLSRPPLLRVKLLKAEETKHLLMMDMHHIITDGASIGNFVRDFMALYKGEELPPLNIQYKDYSEWQNSRTQKKVLQQQGTYWTRIFKNGIPRLNIPFDFEMDEWSNEGDDVHFVIDKEETTGLKALAEAGEMTLYMVLLAIYNVFLSKLCQQEEVVIGTAAANRTHPDLQPVIGLFANTLALKNSPAGEKTFTGFLSEVKRTTLAAFENQDYQFIYLVEKLSLKPRQDGKDLLNVQFQFDNVDIPMVEIHGLKLSPYGEKNERAKFDLLLNGVESGGRMFLNFNYKTGIFKRDTVEKFADYFMKVVSLILEEPNRKLGDIEIISEQKREGLISRFNVDLEDE
jgi:amino acid adenylation domain-containing protein